MTNTPQESTFREETHFPPVLVDPDSHGGWFYLEFLVLLHSQTGSLHRRRENVFPSVSFGAGDLGPLPRFLCLSSRPAAPSCPSSVPATAPARLSGPHGHRFHHARHWSAVSRSAAQGGRGGGLRGPAVLDSPRRRPLRDHPRRPKGGVPLCPSHLPRGVGCLLPKWGFTL